MRTADKQPHIAVFMKSLQGGGAEHVMLMLASAFAKRGCKVDILLANTRGHLHEAIPGDVTIYKLEKAGRWRLLSSFLRLAPGNWRDILSICSKKIPRIGKVLHALEHYLRETRPDAVLSTLPGANIVAAWAIRLSGGNSSLVIREANQFSCVKHTADNFGRLLPRLAKRWYPTTEAVIAVSEGVRDDIVNALQLPPEQTVAILNPVDLQRIRMLASDALPEDSELEDGCRFVLAVGKLEPQKDYPTLLRAFAGVRKQHAATRLVILGEGSAEGELRALAEELGISGLLLLPGFMTNPYAYMRRASVFVLSSAWEGCPNVLLEAMACGCPIVSTDCPSGPREILDNGRYGLLVPVGDAERMAAGITQALAGKGVPYDAETALEPYSASSIVTRYLDVLCRTC